MPGYSVGQRVLSILTALRLPHTAGSTRATLESSKDGELDAQILLWILPEVGNQDPQISRERGQIVVELGVVDQLGHAPLAAAQLVGDFFEAGRGVPQIVIKLVVVGQLAERSFPRAHIGEKR